MSVELAQVGVISAKRPVGEIPDRLPMLEELGNGLLNVHLRLDLLIFMVERPEAKSTLPTRIVKNYLPSQYAVKA
jgi:hypothetical protein